MSEARDPALSDARTTGSDPWSPLAPDPVLVAERQGRWQWPFVVAGTLLALVLTVVLVHLSDEVLGAVATRMGTRALFDQASDPGVFMLPGNVYTFVGLATFGLTLLAVAIVMGRFHQRHASYLWRYHGPLAPVLFFKAAGALLLVGLVGHTYEFLFHPESFKVRASFAASYWGWVAAGVAALLLQTLGEEAIFRGYLLRVWGALLPLRAVIVAGLVTAFTSLHTVNSDFRTDFAYNFVGFLAAEVIYYWALLRTGSLMTTWGLHFANNLLAGILVITVPGSAPDMGFVVYTDPVLSAGGSRFKSPLAYAEMLTGLVMLMVLLGWRRSPFYLPVAPLPALPATPSSQPPTGDDDLPSPPSV